MRKSCLKDIEKDTSKCIRLLSKIRRETDNTQLAPLFNRHLLCEMEMSLLLSINYLKDKENGNNA